MVNTKKCIVGLYVPELVFGHLLTGSNFNDEEQRITGGAFGYGAKLTNILSKEFSVETVDLKSKKKFKKVCMVLCIRTCK